VTSNIKVSVNEVFYFGTTLKVPDIDPNHCHIGFERCFYNLRMGNKSDVFEYVSIFITVSMTSTVIRRLVFSIK